MTNKKRQIKPCLLFQASQSLVWSCSCKQQSCHQNKGDLISLPTTKTTDSQGPPQTHPRALGSVVWEVEGVWPSHIDVWWTELPGKVFELCGRAGRAGLRTLCLYLVCNAVFAAITRKVFFSTYPYDHFLQVALKVMATITFLERHIYSIMNA